MNKSEQWIARSTILAGLVLAVLAGWPSSGWAFLDFFRSKEPTLYIEIAPDGETLHFEGYRKRIKRWQTYPLSQLDEALDFYEVTEDNAVVIRRHSSTDPDVFRQIKSVVLEHGVKSVTRETIGSSVVTTETIVSDSADPSELFPDEWEEDVESEAGSAVIDTVKLDNAPPPSGADARESEAVSAASARVEGSGGGQRERLWEALFRVCPKEYRDIEVYAENPSLTQVCFWSNGRTLLFNRDQNSVTFVDPAYPIEKEINRITFEPGADGSFGMFVLWHNAEPQLSIGARP